MTSLVPRPHSQLRLDYITATSCDFTIRMQVLRDVTIITFQMAIAFHQLFIEQLIVRWLCQTWSSTINAIIQASRQLGYATIRPDQNRAIKSFMEGHDVFNSLPTGTGKSLCSVLPYPTRSITSVYKRVGSIA